MSPNPTKSSARTVRAPAAPRAALACAALAIACGHGDFIWASEARIPAVPGGDYQIAAGDVISVRVWNQDGISIPRARVREDGKISVPFLQDVEVVGMTPADLSRRLETKLKTYIVNPVVTVTIEEYRPLRVTVVGEVARAGVYDLESGAGVLKAVAAAGGLTAYAKRDRIFVLRQGYWADGHGAPARIRFRYDALAAGKAPEALFRVVPGDVVVVE